MDVSDAQTLGFMVFGGFMILSAVGIALVSTLSMKETSFEEALAKQRSQLIQTQTQKAEKKKKMLDKKNKAKKKEEERPDGTPSELGGEEPEAVTCTEPESDPEPAAKPAHEPNPTEPEPIIVTATTIRSAEAPSPKDKKKKKSARVEPAAVVETVAKEGPVMVVPPVVDVPPVNAVTEITKELPAAKTEESKETSTKKKKSKNKPDPSERTVTTSVDWSLLPHGELLSTVSTMRLSDHEVQKLMEVLNQKAGVRQDSWQLACQRGAPLSALKKQLEDKDKLLTTQQEDATTAKNRLRELSKELGAEKSKVVSLEARLSSRVQEVSTLQARIQMASQEHLKQTKQLNHKIGSLQEQLDNGPNIQLARLQQENSILRDALNQATSQAESRQNAELAHLRQDCVRLGRELTECTDALRTDEERRKSLEAKMAAAGQEFAKAKLLHADTERALQQRLDEVSSQLKASQQEAAAVSELQGTLSSREAELQELKVQLENQAAVQESGCETESEQPFESLEEDAQLLRLEEELQLLKQELQQARNHGDELRDKMAASERLSEQREAELKAALTEAESRFTALHLDCQASLQVLFPDVCVEAEQNNWLELFTQNVQDRKCEAASSHSEVQARLKEAEQTQVALQVEFDENRKLLQETEAELKALRQHAAEEENTWKNKVTEVQQQKQTLKEQLLLMEAQLEKQLEEATFTQSCNEELAQVQSQLQQMSIRLQVEQQQRQQLDRELQQARQEVLEQQQKMEADQRSAEMKEVTVEVKEDTSM